MFRLPGRSGPSRRKFTVRDHTPMRGVGSRDIDEHASASAGRAPGSPAKHALSQAIQTSGSSAETLHGGERTGKCSIPIALIGLSFEKGSTLGPPTAPSAPVLITVMQVFSSSSQGTACVC